MSAVFNHLPAPTYRLPPDVREASWSWQWEPSYTARGYDGSVYGVGPTHKYLTCRIALQNLTGFHDLVVEAAAHRGEQQASASYTRPIERWDWTKDLIVDVKTSLATLQLRVVGAALTASGNSQRITAWLHPSSVVAYVEALDDYVQKWRRGEYVEF